MRHENLRTQKMARQMVYLEYLADEAHRRGELANEDFLLEQRTQLQNLRSVMMRQHWARIGHAGYQPV